MKITVSLQIEVDADEWAAEMGCHKSDVRGDVKGYIASTVQQSAGGDFMTTVVAR